MRCPLGLDDARHAEGDGKARWATPGDSRVTKVGHFIRKTRIDELPQILNVLAGDMAFIGPRPEWVLLTSPELAPEGYWLRQSVRPGLSGWAQVNYKPSRTVHMRRRKLGYDLFYINHRSFLLDMLIWFRTLQRLPMLPYQSIRNIIRGDMRRS